jgi:hypothetical protein
MLKAILEYTDCMGDNRTVLGILYYNNIEIIKHKKGMSIYPKVTIRVDNRDKLNELLYELNKGTVYGVRLVKVKRPFFKR